jgi:hypothetical protein
MIRQQPLILISEPDVLSSGLWPDRHPMQTVLWEVGENVRFHTGKITRRVPNSPIFDAGADPVRGLSQHQNSDGKRLVWAASGGTITRWWGPPVEIIATGLPFTRNQAGSTVPTFWDFTHWGDWTLVNQQEAGVYRHKDSDGTFAQLPGAPQDAVLFLKKRNQLLAIGHGVNRRLVSFSDADNIEDWISTADNLAGELPLEELDTPVKAGCHFGRDVAVFGENQMFGVNWVGSPFYFGQNKLLDGIGAIGKHAVVADGRTIYGVGRNGIWQTDGMIFKYIDELALRDYLQENVNWAQGGKIVAMKNDITGCLEFSFPMGASLDVNEGWCYDPRYGGWSKTPAHESAASRVLFERPLGGKLNGDVEYYEYNEYAKAPLDLRSRGLLIQRDPNMIHVGAIVDEVEIFAHKAMNVQLRVGAAQNSEGPYDFTPWHEFDVKQRLITIEQHISGVYHKIEFESYADEWELDLQGFALFGVVEGQKRATN